MKGARVAIVGATGAVGEDLLAVLEQRRFPLAELRLLASPRSVGRTMEFRGETLPVQALDAAALRGLDLCLFWPAPRPRASGRRRPSRRAPWWSTTAPAYRMDPKVPLVVPEVNPQALAQQSGIVANPNCCTIILVMALAPLHQAAGPARCRWRPTRRHRGPGGGRWTNCAPERPRR